MYTKIFKIIEIIIKNYSRQPVNQLIDYYLRLTLILKISKEAVGEFLQRYKLSNPELAVFMNNPRKKYQYNSLVIDHPLKLKLSNLICKQVEECIIIEENQYQSNII